MGLMVDTNVFIHFEKGARVVNLSPWESAERVYVSVVTVSELLMGVHRANTEERRQRRSAFVEGLLARVSVLDFTIATARVHAEIYAELAKHGQLIGAHDLLIAATALYHKCSILTDNLAEFARVPGLRVLPFVP